MPGFSSTILRGGLLTIGLTALSLSFFSGCQAGASKNSVTDTAKAQTKTQPQVEANVFADEPMLSKPYAIIGGTIENVSGVKLESLSVEIELRRREGGDTERRVVAVQPADLAPGEKGKYSLKVLSDEWGGSRLVGLHSAARQETVAFKTLPGAKRPPERNDAKVTLVNTPQRKRSNGDEFINTPETPFKVP